MMAHVEYITPTVKLIIVIIVVDTYMWMEL